MNGTLFALRLRIPIVTLLIALLTGACSSGACPDDTFAGGADLYVAKSCGEDGADGSKDAPLATIGAAIAKAAAGQTILVADGTYGEALVVDKALTLRGAGASKVTITPPSGSVGLIASGGALRVETLTVDSATLVGIATDGIDATLKGVVVTGVKRGKVDGKPIGGHGVQAIGGGALRLQGVRIVENTGTGLLAQGVAKVSIVSPDFMTDPQLNARSPGKAGIVSPDFDGGGGADVTGNWGGGIAIVSPDFMPGKSDDPKHDDAKGIVSPDFSSGGALIANNRRFGVALYGANGKLEGTAIRDTEKHSAESFADGLVVAGSAAVGAQEVAVAGTSIVTGNARAGVLTIGDKDAKVAHRTTIDGDVSANLLGGAWAQGGSAQLVVGDKAVLDNNRIVGVAGTSGALLTIGAALVSSTQKVSWSGGRTDEDSIGDGIGLFDGARAALTGTRLQGNARAGLMIDGAAVKGGVADITAKGVKVTGGGYGVVFNKGISGGAALVNGGGVEVGSKVGKKVLEDASFSVQQSACQAAAGGKSDCSPPVPPMK